MEKHLFIVIIILLPAFIYAQSVGIGTSTPNASSALDISNTTRGLLIPRMTTAGINAIANPAKGLLVYDSTLNQLMVNMGTSASPGWQTIVANSGWNLTGNGGTDPTQQFLGTNDNQPLRFRVNGLWAGELNVNTSNVFLGRSAGMNSAAGFNAGFGNDALSANTTGTLNTAFGGAALNANTSGTNNAADGYAALLRNTTGSYNVGVGSNALASNSTANYNTAIGFASLISNTTASYNTAVGYYALGTNRTGQWNTAIGHLALYSSYAGVENTAAGYNALFRNVNGNDNAAFGPYALYSNNGDLGSYNTAVGTNALYNTSNSEYNTAIGYNAGQSHDLGYNNTILGANCGVSQDGLYNCIAIGQGVICDASSQARIGNSATNSIGGYADWTNISDGRFKRNIKEDVKGIEFIMKLRPVTYNLDITGIEQHLRKGLRTQVVNASFTKEIAEKEKMKWSGFLAQEVEAAAKETGYEFSGVDKPKNDDGFYGLRYAEFVVPLIKAVQELNTTINQQQTLIEDLRKRLQLLEAKNKLVDNHPVTSN